MAVSNIILFNPVRCDDFTVCDSAEPGIVKIKHSSSNEIGDHNRGLSPMEIKLQRLVEAHSGVILRREIDMMDDGNWLVTCRFPVAKINRFVRDVQSKVWFQRKDIADVY